MFNEIDFSKIDTGITPPQDDTERQYYYMAKLAEMVALRERELGRRITYCLQTFGCQMNEKQSEVVAGIMDEIGFKRQETEDADVVSESGWKSIFTVREASGKELSAHASLVPFYNH